MRRALIFAATLALTSTASSAQISPQPGANDPRIQTLAWPLAGQARLTMYPDANLTVLLLPGERIARLEISDSQAYSANVSQNADSFTLRPLRAGATATLSLQTNRDSYSFVLETGRGLLAAYVVRIVDQGITRTAEAPSYEAGPIIGAYRLSGDRQIRPTSIGDDGRKTFIEWSESQALPAVFGIGPSGEEEVVPGYMREGRFTIDRVYSELVFRIDGERVKARRQDVRAAP